jgi:hypothetical protein
MLVRDDAAVAVVDEPGALGLLSLLAPERVRGLGRRDGDLDDALLRALIDVGDGQAGCVGGRLAVADGFLADDGFRPFGSEPGVRGGSADADSGGGNEHGGC